MKIGEKVNSETLCARLRELVEAITHGRPENLRQEFSMRVPAEPERDADLVLGESARRIEELEGRIVRLVHDYEQRLATVVAFNVSLNTGEAVEGVSNEDW